MTRRAGPGLGKGMLGEDLQVVLILGTAAAAAATAKGRGFHAGWLGPQASAGATRARWHAAPEECQTPVHRGRSDGRDRGCGKLGKVPVMPGADWWTEDEGRPLLTAMTGSRVESKEEVLAQNDGSKTPSPGGALRCSETTRASPFFKAAFEAAIVREGSKTPSPGGR